VADIRALSRNVPGEPGDDHSIILYNKRRCRQERTNPLAFVLPAQPLQGNRSHATSRLKLKGDVVVAKERTESLVAYVGGRTALEANCGYKV
jgi:hypothetical protein